MNKPLKLAIIASQIPAYIIAQKATISESILSRIVCGRREATPDEKRRIAMALKKHVSDIFGNES